MSEEGFLRGVERHGAGLEEVRDLRSTPEDELRGSLKELVQSRIDHIRPEFVGRGGPVRSHEELARILSAKERIGAWRSQGGYF